ncbi:putative oxidoreductase [Mycoplana dimorpha]|uniref:Putative oxidoreductase n=2 Tax=Mycoplana dimorpha TaxID=28320 RepID=A0A2T5BEA4_MYCDI|nr:putative oxidoreductase [Mycoplana dimorpha]
MRQETLTAYGATVLRLSLGTMYLSHSVVLKLLTYGLGGTAGYFVSIGLPAWLAYVTFAAEAVGGALLVLGIHTRIVALSLTPALVGAIIWAHGGNGWVFTAPGGGWEYPLFLVAASIAQALLGDGAFALRPSRAPAAVHAQ